MKSDFLAPFLGDPAGTPLTCPGITRGAQGGGVTGRAILWCLLEHVGEPGKRLYCVLIHPLLLTFPRKRGGGWMRKDSKLLSKRSFREISSPPFAVGLSTNCTGTKLSNTIK